MKTTAPNKFMTTLMLAGALLLAGAVLLVGAPTKSVRAQSSDINSIAAKLDRLERDIRGLNRRLNGPKPPAGPGKGPSFKSSAPRSSASSSGTTRVPGGQAYIIRLEQRLVELEGEMRTTTGSVETLTHTVSEMTSRLDKLVSDMDFRLTSIEQRMGGGAQPQAQPGQLGQVVRPQRFQPPRLSAAQRPQAVERVGPATGAPVFGSRPAGNLGQITQQDLKRANPNAAPGKQASAVTARAPARRAAQPPVKQTVLPKGTPKERYSFAFSLLRKADYRNAALAFQEFIDTHPKSKLIANARYWLGKTYFVRKDYRTAAEVFLSAYQTAPKGPKAPDTLLNLGLSLYNLNKKRDACATYEKLAEDFPNATSSIKKRLAKERKRAACG